jgi:hypothetical protein
MKNRRFRSLVTAIFVPSLAIGACSKGSSEGAPAPVPPVSAGTDQAATSAPLPATPLPPPGSVAMRALSGAMLDENAGGGEHETVAPPVDEQHAIAGKIVLAAASRAKVARGDVMFLAARRTGGPPGPGSMIAVQKLIAGDFPMRFAISSQDAMIPGIPFEGRMSITVRVDKDGDAMTRRKGDVFGKAENVKVGARNVVINLDKVQAEDQTLGGAATITGQSGLEGPP